MMWGFQRDPSEIKALQDEITKLRHEVERLRDRLAKRRETTGRLLRLCRAGRVAEHTYRKPSRVLADLERSDRFFGITYPNPAITMVWAAREITGLRAKAAEPKEGE